MISLIIYQQSYAVDRYNTDSAGQYEDGTITCNGIEDCEIICDRDSGCKNTLIQCPTDYKCTIDCSATKACALATINATYSSSLIINDCATGFFTCKGITLYLPPNVNGQAQATVDGADNGLSQGDSGSIFDGEPDAPLQFYAIYGWHDIDIVGYIGDYSFHAGTMYCEVGYTSSCSFATNGWTCANTDDICNDPPTPSPTLNPTNPTTELKNNQFIFAFIYIMIKKKPLCRLNNL